jgi:hypothetical protein
MPSHANSINLLISKVPYEVTIVPFTFNGETRYRVSYNGSPEFIFTWDSSLGRMAAIDEDAGTIPDDVEVAIAEHLQYGQY